MSDYQKPKEALNNFHSIMNASVKPEKLTHEEIIDLVYEKFGVKISFFDKYGYPVY